jgi:hypothetical protein|tara:strand:+ start:1844 stop:2524 length:681 start_codon:yes stop_codon:yes gene_type:complete
MNIHLYYRHSSHSIVKNRPKWFSFKSCWDNLLGTVKGKENIKLTLALDGNIEDDFTKDYRDKFQLFSTNHGSSLLSYRDLLLNIKNNNTIQPNDLIYFLENDYLHVDGWDESLLELYNTYDVSESYISLYDHNDKYTHPMYDDLVTKLVATSKCHWRTTPSTCGSFIITKKLFDLDYDIWSTAVGDHNTFLHLNQTRNRFVFTPIPGLSTHCMENLLSPTIDWSTV